MDELLNKETLKNEIRSKFNESFSKALLDANKKQIEQQIEQVASFLITFSENEYFSYFATKDPNESIELHISNLPNGITQFENWFNTGLLDFAKNIFSFLTETMSSNIHFARLLDNRDYEQFIIDSKTKDTDIEQWKSILEPIFQMSDTPYLVQAAACINLSLDNAALSLLHKWIQSLWFEDKSIQKVFDDAKAIVAIRNNASKAGKKGATNRWSSKDQTQKYAIELYKKGNFNNPSQAIDDIAQKIIEFGKSVNFSFTTSFQAQKTIYRWLLSYTNKQIK